ncbi:MAG TPA: S1 RNA-binding domain-containing protein, partial [Gammaproteobacteria bacterium]|nr:S1 RNA-binding domain-containing protein [Gammaproteobacteria bacterium]
MADIGKINRLRVKSENAYGFVLDGESLGEVFLSNKQAKRDVRVNSLVDVFIYIDSNEKLV